MEARLLPQRAIVTNIYTCLKSNLELDEYNPAGNKGLVELDFRKECSDTLEDGRHVRVDLTIPPKACFL